MKLPQRLAKPITIETRRHSLLYSSPERVAATDEHNRDQAMRAVIAQLEKIDELSDWLGLEKRNEGAPVNWPILAMTLAQKFVPGFRVKDVSLNKNRGRKKEWDWEKFCQLMADVELLQREKPRTDSEACQVLSTTQRFNARWGTYSARTLRNKLVLARREESNIFSLIRNRARDLNLIADEKLLEILVDVFSVTKK